MWSLVFVDVGSYLPSQHIAENAEFTLYLFLSAIFNKSLIKGEFQVFFYFSGLTMLLVLNTCLFFQQSVDVCLCEWLLDEQKWWEARSIQDVARQVFGEARAEAEKHC